jgi:hypothetical protein
VTPALWCAVGAGALVVFVGVPLAIGTWFLRAANDHDFDLLDVPMGDELGPDDGDIPPVAEVDPSDVWLNDRIARIRLDEHANTLDRALGPEGQQPQGDR